MEAAAAGYPVTHSFRILSSMLKVKVEAAAGIPRFTGIALFSHPQNQTKVKKQVPPSLSIFMILTLSFSSYSSYISVAGSQHHGKIGVSRVQVEPPTRRAFPPHFI